MERSELINYLVNEDVISEHQAHEMDNFSLFVEAVEYNGIIGYDLYLKDLIQPYYQEYYSNNPEELNISIDWIKKKYHELLKEGLIQEESESDPKTHYTDNIFTV